MQGFENGLDFARKLDASAPPQTASRAFLHKAR